MKYLNLYEDIKWEFDEEEESEIIIYDDRFTQFLIDNNIYDKYILNIYEQRCKGCDIEELNKYLISRVGVPGKMTVTYAELINYAFNWASAPEQHGYWQEISDKWRQIANNLLESIKWEFDEEDDIDYPINEGDRFYWEVEEGDGLVKYSGDNEYISYIVDAYNKYYRSVEKGREYRYWKDGGGVGEDVLLYKILISFRVHKGKINGGWMPIEEYKGFYLDENYGYKYYDNEGYKFKGKFKEWIDD